MNASKKNYVQPVITVVKVKVENGYGLSDDRPIKLLMGSEWMNDGGYIEDINLIDDGDKMTEGIQQGGRINF